MSRVIVLLTDRRPRDHAVISALGTAGDPTDSLRKALVFENHETARVYLDAVRPDLPVAFACTIAPVEGPGVALPHQPTYPGATPREPGPEATRRDPG